MADGRSRLILLSVALAESIWLFALFSVLGLIGDLGGSPLPWLSLFLLMVISIVSGHLLAGAAGDEVSIAIRQSLLALLVIYLLLGTGTFLEDTTFDAGWIFRLLSGELKPNAAIAAVFALLASVWMWRHGLRLGTDRYPEDRLARVFKIGIGVLAVAVLIDQARTDEFRASALLVPFFGATLVGLAIGRLPEGGVGQNTGQWARVIGVTVFGIMGVGLLIGLVGGLYGNGGVRLLFAGWGLFVDGLLWVLRYPVTWITVALEWLLNLLSGGREVQQQQLEAGQSGVEIFGIDPEAATETGNTTVDTIINILQYPVIALIIIASFFVLAMAFRRFGSRGGDDEGDERESMLGELETSGDMSRLLAGLMPGWWRRKQGRNWRHPDESGFAEVFKLYFDSIRMGVKWGMTFHPQMTPAERLPLLEAALPGAPVREVTDRFNAACYGKVPTDARKAEELRSALQAAEKALQNR
ncbi:MAG: hypothetical protein O3B04_07915 [Chloroflexi bacterium]|nr:hypothetical protein [Chloroflexota bacterium]